MVAAREIPDPVEVDWLFNGPEDSARNDDTPAPVWDAIDTSEAGAVADLEWQVSPRRPALVPPDAPSQNRRMAELDAERAVLGAVLIDGAAIAEALDHIKAEDFSTPEHRAIFGAMVRLYERGQRPEVFAVNVESDGACNAGYLAGLVNGAVTSVQAGQYAALVAAAARRRRICEAAARVVEVVGGGGGEAEIERRMAELAAVGRKVAEAGAIGDLTALDLPVGPVPDQLAGPFLTPEGPTVIYARGGTGKGLLTCLLVMRLVRSGHVVMVLDYEGHRREWSFRLRGLGLGDDELRRVHYRAPFGSEWTAQTGALSAVVDLVRADAERVGADYLIIDSYSVATSNGDTMGGEQAAREYFGALARIGLPSLTIAHVRGDSGQFPDRPFGSVFVHNLARETWSIERVGTPQIESSEAFPYEPAVVALEIRNKKANGRSMAPAQFVTFTFYADGTIEVKDDQPTARPIADLAADALADGPMVIAKIAAAIKEDTGRAVSEDTLRSALIRESRRFVQADGKRPRAWSLR